MAVYRLLSNQIAISTLSELMSPQNYDVAALNHVFSSVGVPLHVVVVASGDRARGVGRLLPKTKCLYFHRSALRRLDTKFSSCFFKLAVKLHDPYNCKTFKSTQIREL